MVECLVKQRSRQKSFGLPILTLSELSEAGISAKHMAMPSTRYTGPAMTLENMRSLGVRAVDGMATKAAFFGCISLT
jgi:hypothetical protein